MLWSFVPLNLKKIQRNYLKSSVDQGKNLLLRSIYNSLKLGISVVDHCEDLDDLSKTFFMATEEFNGSENKIEVFQYVSGKFKHVSIK